MGFYFRKAEELIYVQYDILGIDFEFASTKIVKNKAKRYIQEIVEIGAIYKSEHGELEYSAIIKPKYFIKYMDNGSRIIASERFTKDKILKGIELEDVLKYLTDHYIQTETKIITWGRGDYNVLKNICEEYGLKMPFLYDDYIDLSESFMSFYNHKYTISLDKAMNTLNIEIRTRHYALLDSRSMIEILFRMLEDGFKFD
ncbi:exonuclease domain-containing protein [Clostridium sp. DL1XJH146]